MRVLSSYARHALRPRRNLSNLALSIAHCCLQWYGTLRLPFYIITRLNRFTVSHCGSHTPCPTLKPRLATLAPRTRYRLFAKLYRVRTFTQLYYTHRTGAPIVILYHFYCIKKSLKLPENRQFEAGSIPLLMPKLRQSHLFDKYSGRSLTNHIGIWRWVEPPGWSVATGTCRIQDA